MSRGGRHTENGGQRNCDRSRCSDGDEELQAQKVGRQQSFALEYIDESRCKCHRNEAAGHRSSSSPDEGLTERQGERICPGDQRSSLYQNRSASFLPSDGQMTAGIPIGMIFVRKCQSPC